MASPVSLEQVEELATQLSAASQLQLVTSICQHLRAALPPTLNEASSEEETRQALLATLDAWLAECDKVAELWEGDFDAAADLRRIRDEG